MSSTNEPQPPICGAVSITTVAPALQDGMHTPGLVWRFSEPDGTLHALVLVLDPTDMEQLAAHVRNACRRANVMAKEANARRRKEDQN